MTAPTPAVPDLLTRLEQLAVTRVGVLDQILAARRFLHDDAGHSQDFPCVACVDPRTVATALDHLDAHPRDARGVRRIFHDARCVSGCGPESDHADRTQTTAATALRRFRAVLTAALDPAHDDERQDRG